MSQLVSSRCLDHLIDELLKRVNKCIHFPPNCYSHTKLCMFFTAFDVQLSHLSQLLLTVHMFLFVPHLMAKLSLGASLSMQMVCNPWHQQTDVGAKNSGSCHNSLSEYRLILHSFVAYMAIFIVVNTSLYIFNSKQK